MNEILEAFYKLKDEKQAHFAEKLTKTTISFLGIKIPMIKTFVKHYDISYHDLQQIPLNIYVEQDILYGMFLNKLGKKKDEKYYQTFLTFTAYLDNWMCCDTFVSNTNFQKDDYDKLYELVQSLLTKEKPIQRRCGLVLLKKYFIKVLTFEQIFTLLKKVTYGNYYVDMACAWLLCSVGCYNFTCIYDHLDDIYKLSPFVYNKTIQKMKESYLISNDQKKLISYHK